MCGHVLTQGVDLRRRRRRPDPRLPAGPPRVPGHGLGALTCTRSSGNPVDVRAPALPVAGEMGAYVGAGWRVPELLDQLRVTGALYFDSVSQGRGRPAHDSSLILGSPIRGSG